MSKSPKFCTTQKGNYLDIKKDVKVMTKKLKIIDKYKDTEWNDDSLVRNKSTKEVKTDNIWVQYIVDTLENLEPEPVDTPSNITEKERRALIQLAENRDIVIKKADKTNVFVIMDSTFYEQKLVLNDHLHQPTYEVTTPDADQKVYKEQLKLLEKHRDCLNDPEFIAISDYEWKTSLFYVNPKISKCKEICDRMKTNNSVYLKMPPPPTLKARPIIAGPCSPTKRLSQLISKILAPLVPLQDSYIKDDWAFIKNLTRELDYEAELFTCDIVSLYTSIPHHLGIEAITFWITTHRASINTRFTVEFIIEAVLFILQNNNFSFGYTYWHQREGTGMGVDFAGNYACLCVGYLEKVKLFELYMIPRFSPEEITLIKEAFKRYVDDGFIFWPIHLDINVFIEVLGMLHPDINYTIEKGEIDGQLQSINFLDIKVILHNNKTVETELFYKPTNNHHYLEYNSFHAKHVRDNIPYNFFKKIIVFTSDSKKEKSAINDMRTWLYKSNYPQVIVDKGLHNARLQGPGPDPSKKLEVIPFVTLNCSNFLSKGIVKKANMLLENCPDETTKDLFKQKRVIHAMKQPPSILRQLTSAKFHGTDDSIKPNGIFKCSDKRCKIHKSYLVQCKEFKVANGETWTVPSHITCKSKMVIYYQICTGCNIFSNIGKTNNLRKRTNGHINHCKTGVTTDKFDRHVFACKQDHLPPFFKLYVLLEVNDYEKLRVYESSFHNKGFDTCNRYKASSAV